MIRPREIESSNIVRRHRSDDLCLPLLVGWCSDWEHILSLRFKQTERARRCARFFLSSLVWLWISAFKLRHPQFSAEFETFQYLQTTHYIQTTVLSPQDNGQVWIRNLLPWVDILIVVFLYMFSSQTFLQQAIKFCSNSAVFLLSNGQCGRTSGITAWRRTVALQARRTKQTRW